MLDLIISLFFSLCAHFFLLIASSFHYVSFNNKLCNVNFFFFFSFQVSIFICRYCEMIKGRKKNCNSLPLSVFHCLNFSECANKFVCILFDLLATKTSPIFMGYFVNNHLFARELRHFCHIKMV